MKKFLGAIISGLVGVLSLVFLTMPAFVMDLGLTEEKATGWEILTKSEWKDIDLTAVTWYRIFAWIVVVLAIVLIAIAVLQLLSSLGIFKSPALFNKISHWALGAIVLASILALVANFGIRAEMIDAVEPLGEAFVKRAKEAYSVGASLWVVSIVNLIGGVLGKVFVKD